MLLSPCYHHLFFSHTYGQWLEWLGKEADWYTIYLIIIIILCKGHHLVNIHMGYKYICLFWEIYAQCSSPNIIPCDWFSNHFPFKSLTIHSILEVSTYITIWQYSQPSNISSNYYCEYFSNKNLCRFNPILVDS